MPEPSPPGRRVSHETRLLIATIIVSAVVLLLLARLRFPEVPSVATTTQQPLERLAARATYADLATSIARLEELIAPNLLTLQVAPAASAAPRQLSDLLASPAANVNEIRHVPALRIDVNAAVTVIDAGTRVTAIMGSTEPHQMATVTAFDAVRRLARISVPDAPLLPLRQLGLSDLRAPTYVIAVEGTRAGVTLRPVFLGRTDRFSSARWSRPLMPVGGAVITPGALVFTLDGDFLGCVVEEGGSLAIASAVDVLETAGRLAAPNGRLADAGIALQPLTAGLAAATGTPRGVVVAEVFDDGPAVDVLEVGDVITEVDGQPVSSPEDALLRLGAHRERAPVSIGFFRDRTLRTASLPMGGAAAEHPLGPAGLNLQPVPDVGVRIVGVGTDTPFAAAGLLPGDIIVRVDGEAALTAADVERVMSGAAAGEFLLLVVRRNDRQQVVAVQTVPKGDAARP